MRVAFGTDERTPVTDEVKAGLRVMGHEVVVVAEDHPWPDVGRAVGETVAAGAADVGVVFCWTGTGVSIAANKVRGVRAALCTDAQTAEGARKWNDANVLAMGLRLTTADLAREMVQIFLQAEADEGELGEIAKLD